MLHELVVTHRHAILARAQRLGLARAGAGTVSTADHDAQARPEGKEGWADGFENGLPMFLTQLAERLTAGAAEVPLAAGEAFAARRDV
jgi:hypothetical protein